MRDWTTVCATGFVLLLLVGCQSPPPMDWDPEEGVWLQSRASVADLSAHLEAAAVLPEARVPEASRPAHAVLMVTTLAQLADNEGGAFDDGWDEMFLVVSSPGSSSRIPKQTEWKITNRLNGRQPKTLNKIIWQGDIRHGESVRVNVVLKEWDPITDDIMGGLNVNITNDKGKLTYTYDPVFPSTTFDGYSKYGNYRFQMVGIWAANDGVYKIYFKKW